MGKNKKQLLAEDWGRFLKVHRLMSQDIADTENPEARKLIRHERDIIEGLMMGYVIGGTNLLVHNEGIDEDFTEWLIRCQINPFEGYFHHILEDYYTCKEQEQEEK